MEITAKFINELQQQRVDRVTHSQQMLYGAVLR